MKYRIVTNGVYFKIETYGCISRRKEGFFRSKYISILGWHTYYDQNTGQDITSTDLEAITIVFNRLVDLDREEQLKSQGPWTPVTSNRI